MGGQIMIMHNHKTINNQQRGMKLLTQELRNKIPPLYAQDGKGGQSIIYTKYFTPDSSWTWYVTEYDGEDTFFGLVDGHCKELGYFSLSELEELTGPMGLPVERELRFKPMCLQEIAPELFETTDQGDEQ
jgi:hypothetical protein